MAKAKTIFTKDLRKAGSTRRLSNKSDSGTDTARRAGREYGKDLLYVLEMGGDVSSVRASLVSNLINALSDRVDKNALDAKLDEIPVTDRPAFFAGIFDKIMG